MWYNNKGDKMDTIILFDMDGTLWDVTQLTYEEINKLLKNKGINYEVSMEKVKSSMGLTAPEVAENYMPEFSKEKRETILTELTSNTADRIAKEGGNLYPYIEETLKELSSKYLVGIVSNSKDKYIESLFKTTSFKKYINDYMGASSYSISKAEAIKEVVRRNNCKKCIYVGDTIRDKDSSSEAGVEFIWASYGFGKNIESNYKINSLKELPSLVEQIIK